MDGNQGKLRGAQYRNKKENLGREIRESERKLAWKIGEMRGNKRRGSRGSGGSMV